MTLNINKGSDMESDPESPKRFYLRDATSAKSITSMLEIWDAGTEEDPHHHPDDMSVMIKVQFYDRQIDDLLVTKGDIKHLETRETAYIPANQIHSVNYASDTKLVYIQDGVFGFVADA